MISIFKYIKAWHSEAVSSEMVELSSVISDASTMSRKLIVQHMKTGNTFAVPQSALLGTKWWHSATSGYLRIDSKSEWICWPTGCITAKCGRNTASNQRIAKKSYEKVKALPHDKCRKEIIAARKEHKAKSERKWKAVKKREAQKKEQAVKSHVKNTAAERSTKVQAARQVALQKKEVAAKLKAVKDRIERENKNMLKLEPGLRKMILERKQKADQKEEKALKASLKAKELAVKKAKVSYKKIETIKISQKAIQDKAICHMTRGLFGKLRLLTSRNMSITRFTEIYLSVVKQYKGFYCGKRDKSCPCVCTALVSFERSMQTRSVVSTSLSLSKRSSTTIQIRASAFGLKKCGSLKAKAL